MKPNMTHKWKFDTRDRATMFSQCAACNLRRRESWRKGEPRARVEFLVAGEWTTKRQPCESEPCAALAIHASLVHAAANNSINRMPLTDKFRDVLVAIRDNAAAVAELLGMVAK